jgi:rRNA maturation protein Nop10
MARNDGLRQADRLCIKCGSWYRRGEICNVCGHEQPIIIPVTRKFSREGHPSSGQQWNKKTGRYEPQAAKAKK